MNTIKQVVEVPLDEFQTLKETGQKILNALEKLHIVAPAEFLTTEEFMKEISCSRWKLNDLRDSGKLKIIKRGRKIYIPRTELQRYFAGEMEGT